MIPFNFHNTYLPTEFLGQEEFRQLDFLVFLKRIDKGLKINSSCEMTSVAIKKLNNLGFTRQISLLKRERRGF